MIQEHLITNKKVDKIDEKFLQLEKDLYDITDLFKEVHTMILDQSYDIDTIEQNLNIVKENTKSGTAHLEIAKKYRNSALPLIGSGIGFVLGGPLGLMIGSKAGLIAMGICGSFTALAGSVTGYYVCKL